MQYETEGYGRQSLPSLITTEIHAFRGYIAAMLALWPKVAK